jgi:hypothetical protein
MQVGDLVKYVGHATFYKNRVGIVANTYAGLGGQSAQVHYPGLEGQGRDRPGLGQVHDGLHPMGNEELELISASR